MQFARVSQQIQQAGEVTPLVGMPEGDALNRTARSSYRSSKMYNIWSISGQYFTPYLLELDSFEKYRHIIVSNDEADGS